MRKQKGTSVSNGVAMDPEYFSQLRWVSGKFRGRHDARRHFENRYLFATLTVYVLGTAAAMSKDTPLANMDPIWIWRLSLSLAGVTSGYLAFLHIGNAADKHLAQQAENKILSKLGCQPATKGGPRLALWSWLFQTLAIAVLAVGCAGLITGSIERARVAATTGIQAVPAVSPQTASPQSSTKP